MTETNKETQMEAIETKENSISTALSSNAEETQTLTSDEVTSKILAVEANDASTEVATTVEELKEINSLLKALGFPGNSAGKKLVEECVSTMKYIDGFSTKLGVLETEVIESIDFLNEEKVQLELKTKICAD